MSMHPLLERDGLNLPYTALILIWTAVAMLLAPTNSSGAGSKKSSSSGTTSTSTLQEADTDGSTDKTETRQYKAGVVTRTLVLLETLPQSPLFCVASILLLVALHGAKVLVSPPAHLPWLWDRAFTTVGFVYLAAIAAHLQLAQWRLADSEGSKRRRKQKLS
jgi:alpha-1,3-glucosyltransferase